MINLNKMSKIILTASSFLNVTPLMAQQQGNLEEIVVTAQKRTENINKVGMQITAISGDTLRGKGVSSAADIANVVPGLSYTNSENNTPVYTLRGVGFYSQALSAAPTVSVYMNEIPLPFSVLTKNAFYDLERVEILKGPQGTLYGQNSTGGAINIITQKPTDHFEAGLSGGYGNFDRYNIEGYISGPLTDKINARIAGRYERGDGWQKSNTRPGDTNGKLNNAMGRLIVEYEASDKLRLNLNVNGWLDKSDPQAGQYKFLASQFPGFENPLLANEPFASNNARSANWSPGSIYAHNSFWQAAFRGDLELADKISLISISTYSRYHQRQGTDQDGLEAHTLDHIKDFGDIKSFIQEVRLSIESIDKTRFIIGGNYESSHMDQSILNPWNDTTAATFFTTFGYPVSTVAWSGNQTRKSFALFANAERDIGKLTLKAGLRYTDTKLTGKSCEFDLEGGPTNTGAFFYDIVFGGAFGPFPGGHQCLAGNNLNRVVNGVAPGAPGEYSGVLKEDNVSFRVGADWRLSNTILLYANAAKGYKSGGYPVVAASAFTQYEPVKQEMLVAYDTGFKATLLNNSLRLNGALFYYDYSDKQILARLIDPVFGILAVLQNIPKSTIKGAEFEATVTPVEGLRLSASYTYLKATIDEFQGINGVGVTGNFNGTPVPFTPKHQTGLDVDYETAAFSSWRASFGASLNYRSDTISVVGGEQNIPPPARPQNSRMLGIDGYTLIDLRTGLRNDHWNLQMWVKNVTNKYYWNNAVLGSDAISRFAGMPRTFGIQVGYRF